MLRKFMIVLVLALILTACAKRPKEHLPQPDKSAKVEVRNVIYALFDAFRVKDNKRIEKPFEAGWYLMNDNGQVARQTVADSVKQLDLVMIEYKNKQYSDDIIKLNIIPVDDVIISNPDELGWLIKEENEWITPIINLMEKEDLLLSFYSLPIENGDKKVRIMFNFLMTKKSGRWMIKLMHSKASSLNNSEYKKDAAQID